VANRCDCLKSWSPKKSIRCGKGRKEQSIKFMYPENGRVILHVDVTVLAVNYYISILWEAKNIGIALNKFSAKMVSDIKNNRNYSSSQT
jgi:hypothetical protein